MILLRQSYELRWGSKLSEYQKAKNTVSVKYTHTHIYILTHSLTEDTEEAEDNLNQHM